MESADNPWQTVNPYYGSSSPLKGQQISNPKHHQPPRQFAQVTGSESQGYEMNTRVVDTYDQFLQQRGQPLSQNAAPDSLAQQRDNELKMNRFRQVVSRDLTTFIGLLQQFKLHDRNNNGTLEYGEFETIINEYNIGVQ